jgi:hypothetical protein
MVSWESFAERERRLIIRAPPADPFKKDMDGGKIHDDEPEMVPEEAPEIKARGEG